jgi:predicted Zn finger-like uncharacterized protein
MGFLDMKAEIGDLGWEAVGASDSSVMILTCPECATSYFVDDSRISAAGRTVKCSSCGARWTALPEAAEATPAPSSPPEPQPASSAAAPAASPAASLDDLAFEPRPMTEAPFMPSRLAPAPRREANGMVLVWAGAAIAAALLIAGVIGFRAQVVRLLPASQAAYAGLGLPVSSLAIEKVRADPAFQGGRPVLAVTGQIRNLRDAPATAPPLRVSLLDRRGHAVAAKVARPIDAAVPARAVRHFAISIVDPPASVQDLEVTFEPVSGAPAGGRAAGARASAPVGPQPVEAQPLPMGSPDALPAPK